jgi:hypothetical protein
MTDALILECLIRYHRAYGVAYYGAGTIHTRHLLDDAAPLANTMPPQAQLHHRHDCCESHSTTGNSRDQ